MDVGLLLSKISTEFLLKKMLIKLKNQKYLKNSSISIKIDKIISKLKIDKIISKLKKSPI